MSYLLLVLLVPLVLVLPREGGGVREEAAGGQWGVVAGVLLQQGQVAWL